MDLGPHAVFIWMSYLAVGLIVAALIAWVVFDGQRQQRLLSELEARGVRRRSRSST